MDTTTRARLRALAEQYLADHVGSHRLDHTVRVVGNAMRLAAYYLICDVDALEAAAWLHDLGRGVQRAEGMNHAEVSARLAEEQLPALGFDSERVRLIARAIADHRFSARRVPGSLEGRLLQDADRLDALGAIGIARTFAYEIPRGLYHPDDPFAAAREPRDDEYTLDHFYAKLLVLPETLHTPEARELAHRRVAFMRNFLREFAEELGCPYPERDDR